VTRQLTDQRRPWSERWPSDGPKRSLGALASCSLRLLGHHGGPSDAPNTAFHRLRTASQSSPHCSLEPCIFGFEPFTGFELLDRGRVVGHTWTPWNVASFELWSALAPR
jgi:hypothetical protein